MEVVCFASLLSFRLCYISSLILVFPPFKMAPTGYDVNSFDVRAYLECGDRASGEIERVGLRS